MNIHITGWKRVERVLEAMLDQGYQVAVYWDGTKRDEERTYTIEYTHPLLSGLMFVLPEGSCSDGACAISHPIDPDDTGV